MKKSDDLLMQATEVAIKAPNFIPPSLKGFDFKPGQLLDQSFRLLAAGSNVRESRRMGMAMEIAKSAPKTMVMPDRPAKTISLDLFFPK
jgi:hypothetical protein